MDDRHRTAHPDEWPACPGVPAPTRPHTLCGIRTARAARAAVLAAAVLSVTAAATASAVPRSPAAPVAPGSPGPTAVVRSSEPIGEWPLQPQPAVVRGFDPPDERWSAGHRGVDLLGRRGQVVRSALPGRVWYVGRIAGRGVVVVWHGDTRTTYEPVTASLARGDTVAAGGALGRLEQFGSHCLPSTCLHWGWIRNVGDVYLNPLLLVGAGPVRLLPL